MSPFKQGIRTVMAAIGLSMMAGHAAHAVALEGFETPALAAGAHTYTPTGSPWTFAGVTGTGIQRNGSAFTAPAAPEGQQTAFLKSNDGRASIAVTLSPGIYRVSFMAARRVNNGINPVQVWVNNNAVGAPLTPPTTAFSRMTTANVTITTAGSYNIKLGTTTAGNYATFIDAVSVDTPNPFDALYPTNFLLKPLAADAIQTVAKPAAKATSLATASYVDPEYGTRVYKATAASDYATSTFSRHEYSRRQAFNANSSRYLSKTSNGYWLLHNADTFAVQPRTGLNGALNGMAGECEAIWHPTNPNLLWYTAKEGGLIWYEKNVETDQDTVVANFTSRVQALWPQADRVWMKGEGTSSADGRYFAFMATRYDSPTQTNIAYGLFTWDRQTDQIIGTLPATAFNGAWPDHVSISPSGLYVVPSWDANLTLGTRVYTRDFQFVRQLTPKSEHSDLAIGPNGEDYFVFTDYDSSQIRAINVATGASIDLLTLFPRSGSGYAAHISGKAYGKPGWVVVSTYADYANYQAVYPDGTVEAPYRKVMLLELKIGGKKYSLAHTRAAANFGGYDGEHQATISQDGSRVLFASNFNQGDISSYMIGLPSWVYVGSTGGTPGNPDPGSGPLNLTLGTVSRPAGSYSATFQLTSSVAAACRMASQPNTPYAAMYDNLTASANGLSHSKTASFGTTGPQTVYVACKATSSGEEKALTVAIP